METEWTLGRVLSLAIQKEEESIQLYSAALEKVKKISRV
jgi:rubrerythrin